MAHAGSKGRDLGMLVSYPFMTAYFFAARGEMSKAMETIDCLREIWDEYAKPVVEEGNKDEVYLNETFRSHIGWAGFYMLVVWYIMKLNTEFVTKEGLAEDEISQVMATCALTGFKFMELSFTNLHP
jgi:hypothetical protein